MSRARRTYPPEFKAEAVRLVREDGMPVARVAASLGVDRTLVLDWVRKADEASLAGGPAATTPTPTRSSSGTRSVRLGTDVHETMRKAMMAPSPSHRSGSCYSLNGTRTAGCFRRIPWDGGTF